MCQEPNPGLLGEQPCSSPLGLLSSPVPAFLRMTESLRLASQTPRPSVELGRSLRTAQRKSSADCQSSAVYTTVLPRGACVSGSESLLQ